MERNTVVTRLNASDIAAATFAVSPAHEAVRIVRALVAPARFPAHRALLRSIRAAAPPVALGRLSQVVTARGYVPDFLTPTTEDPAEVPDLIRAAPPEQVVEELAALLDDGRCDPVAVTALRDEPERTASTLADAVAELWGAAVEPLWPAMLEVLRADIRSRTHTLARSGFAAMVATLHPTLVWTGDAIHRTDSAYAVDTPPGQGLTLVPTIFGWPNVQTSGGPAHPPRILYPARNATSDWVTPPGPAVAALIGPTRAKVLRHLDFPATTSDVAAALGLALSTTHHHLQVLTAAGLVDRHRQGNAVWHLRTELGDQLNRRT